MRETQRVPLRYRLLRHMPARVRFLLIYVGSPKMTVGASAIIWDAERRVLLVHHTYRNPAWGFPSGLVCHHEEPSATLERELREELGVLATAGVLLHAEIHAPARHLTLYYEMSLLDTPHVDGLEIDALKYAALEELKAVMGARVGGWLWTARSRKKCTTG